MEQRKLWLGMMVVGLLSSAALAGGPFGPPMSLLDQGQWAADAAYFHEEMDLWGCTTGVDRDWDNVGTNDDPNWVEGSWSPENFADRIHITDFETDAIYGSLEYGLCENWDVFLRLGMASAEATLLNTSDRQVESLVDDESVWTEVVYENNIGLDFGYGFAWQVGTAFTICETGSVTWGGRMQFGMADPDDDSVSMTQVDEEALDGDFVERATLDADIDFWQAVAYIGPTWQASDAWSIYGGGGWQVLQATYEASGTGVGTWEPDVGPDELEERFSWKESGHLKHASAILVLGGVWTPNESAKVGAEVVIGEGGKWGWGIGGQFPF